LLKFLCAEAISFPVISLEVIKLIVGTPSRTPGFIIHAMNSPSSIPDSTIYAMNSPSRIPDSTIHTMNTSSSIWISSFMP